MQVLEAGIDRQRMGQEPASCVPAIPNPQWDLCQVCKQCRLKSILKQDDGFKFPCPQLLNEFESSANPTMFLLAIIE